jgi:membrane protease YdiL (CAAX protease family)
MSIQSPSKPVVLAGLLLTAVLFAVCVLTSVFLPGIAGQNLSPSILFLITRLMFWLCLGLVYLYCIKIEGQPLLLWRESKNNIGFYLISVVAVIGATFIGAGIIHLIVYLFKLNNKSPVLQAIFKYGIPLRLFIVITAAFVEEMIFRGYLMPRLFFKSAWWPIIISSLIFGLGHFRYGTFANVAVPVFIGFVFAWHYQKYRNLKVLIICHFLIDFVSVVLLPK